MVISCYTIVLVIEDGIKQERVLNKK